MNGTRRRFRSGIALLLLLVAAGRPTWALDDGELPRAPRAHGTFRNLAADFWSASNWTRVRFYLLGASTLVRPDSAFAPLPSAVPDVDALRRNHQAATVTWVGHSTLLVQLDGVNILTDPTWSSRVGLWSGTLGVRRFTPPGIAFDDLPPIDLVLISHDHYDHLDEATVRRLARAFNPRFVVPLGIKAWLADRGITNASELDWSESITVKGLKIVCTPAQHGSGRALLDHGQRLWASWVVVGSKRFYFGGDSGYAPHFAMIGEAFGPFGLAALPIGSYMPREIAKPVHMSPEEALQASRDLRSTRFIGIHWGTFQLAREPYDEPPRRIAAEVARLALDPQSILLPKPGETLGW
jgi:N-acyl-phosphatidylethanolamine-hydrolysing phospholipase D